MYETTNVPLALGSKKTGNEDSKRKLVIHVFDQEKGLTLCGISGNFKKIECTHDGAQLTCQNCRKIIVARGKELREN